jgi:predicted phosphodiesterase
MDRFAVVSDIHGNILALEAVMADMAKRSIEGVINLGDNLSGPLWPNETGHILMKQDWLNVQGNHDWNLLFKDPALLSLSDANGYRHLDDELRAWLNTLPASLTLPGGIVAFHGTPAVKAKYLLETVEGHRARLATPTEIAERLDGTQASLVLCGHSHFPRAVQHDSTLIVCPGSLGCQAYIDNDSDHVIETGSPLARYAVIEKQNGSYAVDLISVPYDHLKAAEKAHTGGRPDWEIALRTGFMRSGSEKPYFPGM